MFLACAIMAGHPGAVDLNLVLRARLAPIEDTGAGQWVQFMSGNRVVHQGWVETRANGSGRAHTSPPPGAEDWVRVPIDLGWKPARLRLQALAARIADLPPSDPQVIEGRRFVENVIANTPPAPTSPVRRGLLALGESGLLAQEIQDSPHKTAMMKARANKILDLLRAARERGEVDGLTCSDGLIGLNIAFRIADAVGDDVGPSRWVEYMTATCVHAGGTPYTVGPVLGRAIRAGYSPVLGDLAEKLLREGERFGTRALNQAEYDRFAFAKDLYDGLPLLISAQRIARALVELDPASEGHPKWPRIDQVAEEKAARYQDGVFWQWADLGNVTLRDEIERVAAARRRGDEREVGRIKRSGEEEFRRPRCLRSVLDGEGDLSEGRKE